MYFMEKLGLLAVVLGAVGLANASGYLQIASGLVLFFGAIAFLLGDTE